MVLNELIKLINQQRTYLAPSNIHGVGVFACTDIKEKEIICKFYPEALYSYSFHDLIQNGANEDILHKLKRLYFSSATNLFRLNENFEPKYVYYLNHSVNPNVLLNQKEGMYLAKRDIKKDEEMLMDYSESFKEPFMDYS